VERGEGLLDENLYRKGAEDIGYTEADVMGDEAVVKTGVISIRLPQTPPLTPPRAPGSPGTPGAPGSPGSPGAPTPGSPPAITLGPTFPQDSGPRTATVRKVDGDWKVSEAPFLRAEQD